MVWVSPYFAGQVGNYALDVEVTRKQQLTITLTNPTQGAAWQTGSAQPIQWQSNISGSVNLELFRGEKFIARIAENINNSGQYQYLVPDTLTAAVNYKVVIYSTADQNIRTQSGLFRVDRVMGLEDELLAEVRIYPNPVQDRLQLEFKTRKPESLSIYNATGLFVAEVSIDGYQTSVDMQRLPRGMYLLRCNWEKGVQTVHKILKP
jgi:hypothetical protein